MPIECSQLKDAPEKFASCPKCHATPFVSFLRGSVQRPKRWCHIGKKQDYCAVICSVCKEIVGHESPPNG